MSENFLREVGYTHPVVIRRIVLDKAEHGRLRCAFAAGDAMRHMATELLERAATEQAQIEHDLWDEIAQLFGYENDLALAREGKILVVNWRMGEVVLRGKEPPEDAAPEGKEPIEP